ncbi:hypothetical protein AHiyo8_25240 [Arthrobacter sp. Hiyo8]|nr:hypothetical protein AHiyo8_25240 [Arthrobacter sp. Hiyo8]
MPAAMLSATPGESKMNSSSPYRPTRSVDRRQRKAVREAGLLTGQDRGFRLTGTP